MIVVVWKRSWSEIILKPIFVFLLFRTYKIPLQKIFVPKKIIRFSGIFRKTLKNKRIFRFVDSSLLNGPILLINKGHHTIKVTIQNCRANPILWGWGKRISLKKSLTVTLTMSGWGIPSNLDWPFFLTFRLATFVCFLNLWRATFVCGLVRSW